MFILFDLQSEYSPTGDQPEAISQLVLGIEDNQKFQTLKGVTGSGKTFTVANVIKEVNKPTLVLAHNKTLAAQLYSEFKQYFPNNAVEYFVSYYDYYQPEAYLPVTGTYIEKDLSINEDIEKLRLSTTSSLLSGRRDIIVIASVSCLYGIGNPTEFKKNIIQIEKNQIISRTKFLHSLVQSLYSRSNFDLTSGSFRVSGDIIDIFPSYADYAFKIHFFGDEIEIIEKFDPITNNTLESLEKLPIYPANMFATSPDILQNAMNKIREDLLHQINYFKEIGKFLEAKRLEERTNFDLEMIQELGYCSGIENYSRYIDGREPGTRPFCLLDYFPDDYLMIVDESHVTLSQVHAMYGGDRSRKENLVEYGFRLPAAMDNRPLKYEEFEFVQNQVIYVSATPSDYELTKTEGVIVEQILRPTGLLDPQIEIRPSHNQIDDLINEIHIIVKKNERILITTLTKRMAEELVKFLSKINIRCRYIHSDIDTIERVEIMQGLRKGLFDVLVGVNLLREGLDLPEVSLVVILDADKEGFLRSHRSLTQTIGRAARNVNGKAILYADKKTKSMQKTIDETNYRRNKQKKYNTKNNITPTPLNKSINDVFLTQTDKLEDDKMIMSKTKNLSKKEKEKEIRKYRTKMESAAKSLDFIEAARLRDIIKTLKK
ncbi:MAG: excinuclease ABC subunit UvrB [Flavobacteriaceae bacterium]|nr:excinuclease ABC subunit UvrB [Flavobacteriaceae bacterium]MBT5596685.1 excinuclease ABC subunit UvrB [Flavobacteriaceae bacterium]MBT7320987.1 excinuclease ABC subunit UvrB [Flavobacteriaceae bacterium]